MGDPLQAVGGLGRGQWGEWPGHMISAKATVEVTVEYRPFRSERGGVVGPGTGSINYRPFKTLMRKFRGQNCIRKLLQELAGYFYTHSGTPSVVAATKRGSILHAALGFPVTSSVSPLFLSPSNEWAWPQTVCFKWNDS